MIWKKIFEGLAARSHLVCVFENFVFENFVFANSVLYFDQPTGALRWSKYTTIMFGKLVKATFSLCKTD